RAGGKTDRSAPVVLARLRGLRDGAGVPDHRLGTELCLLPLVHLSPLRMGDPDRGARRIRVRRPRPGGDPGRAGNARAPRGRGGRAAMRWLLGAYADRRTYRAAAYFLLGLPLGILEFVLLVTGLSLGLGLLITLLGIPVLLATLLLARTLASFERQLASSL